MQKKKILLVEDDRTMRNLLGTLLEIEGYNPVIFQENQNQNILEFLKAEMPDAMLLDVHLKFANGLEILQEVRKTENIQNVKVILTSGLDYSEQWLKNGADGFLQKPYMPDELLLWLKQNLQ